jgi:hypothetical protein
MASFMAPPSESSSEVEAICKAPRRSPAASASSCSRTWRTGRVTPMAMQRPRSAAMSEMAAICTPSCASRSDVTLLTP